MFSLKEEFGSQLDESRRSGVHDLSEASAANVAIDRCGSEELHVVEDVESFHAELKF